MSTYWGTGDTTVNEVNQVPAVMELPMAWRDKKEANAERQSSVTYKMR